ncbi:hypothetical protein DEO72_LG8g1432 [Vigna unguiculata]|uniref:Uncharacterized protein n=1 Tax=Vigna unguiculata TaxID=3917 RepID=A0A4D6MQS6_VIGUN|nr:hypothetical protein DEO72_LG8g1432 [Vigna unguiculata]
MVNETMGSVCGIGDLFVDLGISFNWPFQINFCHPILTLIFEESFCALNADEELECGNVYVMHPMNRLNFVVKPSDMGALLLTAKRVTAKVRVVPEKEVEETKLKLDDIEEFSRCTGCPSPGQRNLGLRP